jgi:dephospho-CoA kinase
MKIIAVGGCPASGKTTLMRHVISNLGKGKIKKIDTLVYQIHADTKCIVLGSYAKAGFGGTDRLSMGVQPVALGVMQAWVSDPGMKDWNVLFEGDRLFNSSFIEEMEKLGVNCSWVMLEVSEDIQKQRHKDRNDTQSETWLKGRVTKAKRLKESVKDVKVLNNETVEDLEKNVKSIMEMLGNED